MIIYGAPRAPSCVYKDLPMDTATFRTWARLMRRMTDTLYEDAKIAAMMQVNGLTALPIDLCAVPAQRKNRARPL